ncbi:GNAT family N-acetyltransferase (plasmid) [Niallia taxi]|uniref:GNAT family N-acetyltransferase n=1 Tax=Niallia taxi TaxID=2499688 RepID=UPI0029346EAB|nr:GNAT family protein [Niallia taxi]WOD65490.1 GNAT family N-acetyltransferase [Niallia taxi]
MKVNIRFYEISDAHMKLQLELNNKEHFERWSPIKPSETFYTLEGQTDWIEKSREKAKNDERYDFGIFLEAELIGAINFFFVERGPKQTCMVGYQLDSKHNGKGYMQQALTEGLKIIFTELNFHRVIAGVSPQNPGSIRVLEKAGFVQEGLERKSLLIDGEWRDHILMAILEEDFTHHPQRSF